MNASTLIKIWADTDDFAATNVSTLLGEGARILGIGVRGGGTTASSLLLDLFIDAATDMVLPLASVSSTTDLTTRIKWLGTSIHEEAVCASATADETTGAFPIAPPNVIRSMPNAGTAANTAGWCDVNAYLRLTGVIGPATGYIFVIYTLDRPSTTSVDTNG